MKPVDELVQETEALRARDCRDDITLVLNAVRTAGRAGTWPGHGTRSAAPDLNLFQTGSYVQPTRTTAAPAVSACHRRRPLSRDV